MDKPKRANGFSVMEMLVVVLIISVFSFQFSTTLVSPSLSLFMEKIMHQCTITQEKAFIDKESKFIEIYPTYASFDETIVTYPKSITCSASSFHYNSKGNINKGGTVRCFKEGMEKKLIFQLGSGRVRLE